MDLCARVTCNNTYRTCVYFNVYVGVWMRGCVGSGQWVSGMGNGWQSSMGKWVNGNVQWVAGGRVGMAAGGVVRGDGSERRASGKVRGAASARWRRRRMRWRFCDNEKQQQERAEAKFASAKV